MSKLIFKPEMFLDAGHILTKEQAAIGAQKAFDEWLEKQTVVYAREDRYGWTDTPSTLDTRKAYVVCIEEIKKCEHKEVASYANYLGNTFSFGFKCKHCNKQLKPKNGWEIYENGS